MSGVDMFKQPPVTGVVNTALLARLVNKLRAMHGGIGIYELIVREIEDIMRTSRPAALAASGEPQVLEFKSHPDHIPVNVPTCEKCGKIFLDCHCAAQGGESQDAPVREQQPICPICKLPNNDNHFIGRLGATFAHCPPPKGPFAKG